MPGEGYQLYKPQASLHEPSLGVNYCGPQQITCPLPLVQAVQHVYTPVGNGRKTPNQHNVQERLRLKAPQSSCHHHPGRINGIVPGVIPGLWEGGHLQVTVQDDVILWKWMSCGGLGPPERAEEIVPQYVSPVCCADRALTLEPLGSFTWCWFSLCFSSGQSRMLPPPTLFRRWGASIIGWRNGFMFVCLGVITASGSTPWLMRRYQMWGWILLGVISPNAILFWHSISPWGQYFTLWWRRRGIQDPWIQLSCGDMREYGS